MRRRSSPPRPEGLDAYVCGPLGRSIAPVNLESTSSNGNTMTLLFHRYFREILLALIVTGLVLAVGARAPVFLTPGSLNGVLTDTAILAMMALAQMVVILTRGIDLSVAANLALSGMVVALLSTVAPDLPVIVTIAVAIVVGTALGFANGALVAFVGIPPIVVTLGTLAIFRGLVFVISGGRWITSDKVGAEFLHFPHAFFLGISSLVWLAALVAILMA